MTQHATFGGGCFWGIEKALEGIKGVIETQAGYMGGELENPTYEDVLSHKSGHAEVVQLIFDPGIVSYAQLLDFFFFVHNPTQVNRQGNDVGPQYRSAIFYHSDEQRIVAEAARAQLELEHPIATAIEPAGKFWTAEEYHQKYLDKNPSGYCHVNLPAALSYLNAHGLEK